MQIREAAYADTERIFELYEQTRAAFQRALIGQWADGRPDYDDIFGDIDDGICYTVTDGGRTVAAFVCDFSEDTDYRPSAGCSWYDGEYAVLHRVAVSADAEYDTVLGRIVAFAAARCAENSVQSLRSGAHPKNDQMRLALEQCGFEKCGRLRTASGEERDAYQLSIGC